MRRQRRPVSPNLRPYADERLLMWAFAIAFSGAFVVGLYVGYLIGSTR